MILIPLAERFARRALVSRGVESRYVHSAVAKHHVYDTRPPGGRGREAKSEGELPPIVLLHGISSSAAVFARTIAKLRARSRRVLAVEAPGHGLSGKPNRPLSPEVLFEAMAEVLVRELDEPAVICGNSLGGAVAVSFAMRHPELVRGLLLTSPAGASMDPEAFRAFLKVFDFGSNDDARDFMGRIYYRPPWYAPLLAPDLRRMFKRKAVRDVLAGADAGRLFSAEDLQKLAMPIHLVWGRQDRLLPRENFHFYRDSLPSHAIIEEPDATGHCPHFDDPDGYLDRILSFAQKTVK